MKTQHLPINALFAAGLLAGCGADVPQAPVAQREQASYILKSARWTDPTNIGVCWQSDDHPSEREWIRQVVAREYSQRSEFYLNFTGWGRCLPTANSPRGCPGTFPQCIPIHFVCGSGDNPRVTGGLGRDVASMRFNPTWWGTDQGRRLDVEGHAVHEFGHAAGLAHEHNRPDTPPGGSDRQGTNGDELVGEYDAVSEMNYNFNGDTRLSAGDVLGLHVLYVDTPRPMVSLYRDLGFVGTRSVLGLGRFRASLRQLSTGDNTIRSLRVPSGLAARLCSDEGPDGRGAGLCRSFTEDTTFIGAALDGQVSHVTVTPAITAYDSAGFGGAALRLGIGEYRASAGQLDPVGDNAIGSLRVPAGVAVLACQNEDRTGCALYSADASSLADMNNNISYLQVLPGAAAFEHTYFAGEGMRLAPGATQRGAAGLGALHDAISSLRVTPGAVLTVCTEANPPLQQVAAGTGFCRRLTGELGGTPFVGADWNERISLARVTVEGRLQRLSVSSLAAPGGAGTVTSTPTGISCGGQCSRDFADGTLVTLTATPAAGAALLRWSGCSQVSGNVCLVEMTAARQVSATFTCAGCARQLTLTGSYGGTVTSAPAGLRSINPTPVSMTVGVGEQITLTAAPASGYVFAGFTGCTSVSGATCRVQVSGNHSVTARFEQTPMACYQECLSQCLAEGGSHPTCIPICRAQCGL